MRHATTHATRAQSWLADSDLIAETELVVLAAAGHEGAQRELLDRYLPMLTALARRLARGHTVVDDEDLVAIGEATVVTHLRAVMRDGRYDRPLGYLMRIVRNKMVDHLRANDTVGRTSRDRVRRIRAVRDDLEQQRGRHVSLAQAAAQLGEGEADVHLVHRASPLSLEAPLGDDIDLRDVLDGGGDPADCIPLHDLAGALAVLDDRERESVVHSIVDERPLTELAAQWGTSKTWVSRVRKGALAKMRAHLEDG